MKQIVDFEQAKRLQKLDILFSATSSGYTKEGYEKHDNSGRWQINAPTIGELIEYISKNIPRNDMIDINWNQRTWLIEQCKTYENMSLRNEGCSTELIDALVELCIKIKREVNT